MAPRIHPARAVARPVLGGSRARRSGFAGAIVAITGAAWPEILAGGAVQEPLEAESAFEFDRPVRIAFAGGDGIAKTGDQDIAHGDFGDDALRRAVAKRNVDGGDRRLAVSHAQIDLLVARRA